MRTASRRATAAVLIMTLGGCASLRGGDKPGGSGPAFPSQQSQAKSGGSWSGLTDNPITRGFKSGGERLASLVSAPEAKVIPAKDPVSLNSKPGPTSPSLNVAMARMLEKQGQAAKAQAQYELALKKDPGYLDALLGYAHLLDRQNKLAAAMEKYETACQRHPRSATAANDLGLCYARLGRLEDSADSLARAVQLEPKKTLYRNNIATVLSQMDQSDAALEHLRAVHPPAVAHYNLGYLLQKKGNRTDASHHFAEAVRHDPSFTAARDWANKLAAGTPETPQATPALASRPTPATYERLEPQLPGQAPAPRPLPSVLTAER